MSVLSRFLKMLELDRERCKDLNHPKETAMKGQEVLHKGCHPEEKVVTLPHSFQEVMYRLRRKLMLLKRTILVFSIQLLHSMKTQWTWDSLFNRNSSPWTSWIFLAQTSSAVKKIAIRGRANLENVYKASPVLNNQPTCQYNLAQAIFLESMTQ